MRKIKHLLLVYFDYTNINYTPLDIAYALAYLKKKTNNIKITVLSVSAIRAKKIDEYEKDAYKIISYEPDAVVFFLDNILWSGMFYEGISKYISKKIKEISPSILIGFQSYKIRAERSIKELKNNPQVDFIIRGEPEKPFLDLCLQNNYRSARGFTYRDGKKIKINKDAIVVKKLDTIPSPYLSGLLDDFIFRKKDFSKKSFFMATSRGCPYRCHYCFRSVKFSAMRSFSPKRVLAEIKYLYERGVRDIIFLDDTFIGFGKNFDILLREYQKYFFDKKPPAISIMTRPELVTSEVIKNFALLNVKHIQVGIQTINPDLQYLMDRPSGFKIDSFRHIAENCRKYKIKLHCDCIFGLPGDTFDFFKKTINFVSSLKPYRMQVKQLYLNPDTLFEVNSEKYSIKSGDVLLRNVPFVISSEGWSPADMKKAFNFIIRFKKKNQKIKFKIISEYGYFDSFRSKKTHS